MSNVTFVKLSHPQKVRFLYKTILRLHKGLPKELRVLGDQYAREEFRRHKQCSPMETQLFMTEWMKYTVTLISQLELKGQPKGKLGDPLDIEALRMLNDDQTVQLYELLLATKGISNPVN